MAVSNQSNNIRKEVVIQSQDWFLSSLFSYDFVVSCTMVLSFLVPWINWPLSQSSPHIKEISVISRKAA